MTLESWRHFTDVNLTSQVFLMKAFAAQPDLPTGASIINMLDQQMTAPSPLFFSYAVAKIGLEGATKLAAFELAPEIRVNGIAPGLVLRSGDQTEATFLDFQRQMPLGAGLGADDIIRAVRYLVASPHVTGEVMLVDSGQRLIGPGNSRLLRETDG
jgi:NAD(P)-dependent dehydrogenase (short-subunit alcohol dehydrogenase family)